MAEVRPVERGRCSDGPIRLPPQWDEPDAVTLETTPLVPEARHAFTPDELAARIEVMAAQVAAEEAKTTRAQCWGCGTTPPIVKKFPAYPCNVPGWVVIYSREFSWPEVWCPECALVQGQGEVVMSWSTRMAQAIAEFQAREQMGLRNAKLTRKADPILMGRCRRAIKYLRLRAARRMAVATQ